jgi:hypothetical protein
MKVDAINKIEELVKNSITVMVDGRSYSANELYPVMHNPIPSPVTVHNLRGFCGFINNDIDDCIKRESHLILVNSPTSVDLISTTNVEDAKRTKLVSAKISEDLKMFPFGKFLSQEEFAIAFRSLFVKKDGDDFDYVLSYASKLAGGTQIDGDDDGITQEVRVKRGLTGVLKDKVSLKPIVRLSPYRTFREVEQPESEFLLRVRLSNEEVPTVALFEADGGAWSIKATENIVNYIQSLVKDIPVIA